MQYSSFGDVFPEKIIQSGKKSRFFKISEEKKARMSRDWIFILMLILGLGFLSARLFTLTVIEGSTFRNLAEGNRIRETKMTVPRGIIYDRNKEALVRNIPSFISQSRGVSFESGQSVKEARESIEREYILGPLFAHVLGYTGEIDGEELKERKQTEKKLTIGDKVGKMGIEKSYDEILRGLDGKELVEVDALGNKIRVLGKVDATAGEPLYLTIDRSLQEIAQKELSDKKGAVIVTNPRSGEILVLYSSPSFDPNAFVKDKDIEKILNDSSQPLFNRSISGLYPPGSTFKIVTSIAALEYGVITQNTKIEDTGVLEIGQFSFGNWYFTQYGKKEGFVDIVSALKRSNDIFFYKVGEMEGIERLAKWAKKVGLNTRLGVDIPGEEEGTMPDPVWQEKTKGERWYLGNTYHVAIGQGDILTTPLQVNAWTNVIASGGKLCRPHLNNLGNSSLSRAESRGNLCKDVGIKRETIELIREGMREACSLGGTGWPLFKFKIENEKLKIDGVDYFETYESTTSANRLVEISTACKTGTAEFGDPKGRTHAWFTVFAPVSNPQISVTVLVEGGGEGSNVAAPIAKKILGGWFSR